MIIAVLIISSLLLVAFGVLFYGYLAALYPQQISFHHQLPYPETILFFSDFHLGALMKKKKAAKILSRIDKNVDTVIFGGDLLGKKMSKYYNDEELKDLFAPFQAISDRVMVLGNHDHQMEHLAEVIGFTLLVNQSYTTKKGNVIYGYDQTRNQPHPPETAPDIAVVHQPDYAFKVAQPAFILSGHSHGGQITFCTLRLYVTKGARFFQRGIYHFNQKTLIVTKGIGNNFLPLRLWARPDYYLIKSESNQREYQETTSLLGE